MYILNILSALKKDQEKNQRLYIKKIIYINWIYYRKQLLFKETSKGAKFAFACN